MVAVRAARWLTEKVGLAPFLLLAALLLPCPSPGGTLANLPPLCPVQRLAHLPCPGCGITRSVVCTAHGELSRALHFHPLGPVVWTWMAWAALLRVHAVRRVLPTIPARLKDAAMTVFVLALLTVWVGRLLHLLPHP